MDKTQQKSFQTTRAEHWHRSWHLARAAWAVFLKDLRAELRTRYALNAMLLFAAGTATAVSFAVPQLGLRRDGDSITIQAALLWIALLFAALNSLARSFVYEEEARTIVALRLSAPTHAVYLGKLLFNLALLAAVEFVATLLFLLLLRITIGNFALFIATLAMGSLCLSTTTTILAAIIAKASFKSALFAVLAFPLIVPPLIVAISCTALALDGSTWGAGAPLLQALFSYAVVTFVSSLMLFRFVWEA
jgi:heme exporter protein B